MLVLYAMQFLASTAQHPPPPQSPIIFLLPLIKKTRNGKEEPAKNETTKTNLPSLVIRTGEERTKSKQ